MLPIPSIWCPMPNFANQLQQFANRTHDKVADVIQSSARDVIAGANTPQPGVRFTGGSFVQGKVPVDTDKLHQSLTLAVNGGVVATGADSEQLGVQSFEPGSVLQAGWPAKNEQGVEYGVFVEYGTRRISPRYFVTQNVARWQAIVEGHVSRVKGQ